MKSYTDLNQSKVLTGILQPESADMIWILANPDLPMIKAIAYKDSEKSKFYETLPAWSLGALVDVLPIGYVIVKNYQGFYYVESRDHKKSTKIFNNPVDACVAMIEDLHKTNLL